MYASLRTNRHLNTLVILTRYLIGFAFIPSGFTKLIGHRFTSLGTDTPVGFFFEAMYQSGFYWNFLGFAQLLAGFLLMTQRRATLGALMFLGILLNIWLITVSMHFSGTWVITSLMLLANILLLVWDWDKIKIIFFTDNRSQHFTPKFYPPINKLWVNTGVLLFTIALSYNVVVTYFLLDSARIAGLFTAMLLFATVIVALLRNRRQNKKNRQALTANVSP